MASVASILFFVLGIGGAGCILVSLFSFAIGAIDKELKKITFGLKVLLLGIGLLFIWFVILVYSLREWHC